MQIKSIGIDLGKTTFHLVALGDRYANCRLVAREHACEIVQPEHFAFIPNASSGYGSVQ